MSPAALERVAADQGERAAGSRRSSTCRRRSTTPRSTRPTTRPSLATLFLLAEQIDWLQRARRPRRAPSRARRESSTTLYALGREVRVRDPVRRRAGRPVARDRHDRLRRRRRRGGRSRRCCAPTASSTPSPTASSAATSCGWRCSRPSTRPTSQALTACIDWVVERLCQPASSARRAWSSALGAGLRDRRRRVATTPHRRSRPSRSERAPERPAPMATACDLSCCAMLVRRHPPVPPSPAPTSSAGAVVGGGVVGVRSGTCTASTRESHALAADPDHVSAAGTPRSTRPAAESAGRRSANVRPAREGVEDGRRSSVRITATSPPGRNVASVASTGRRRDRPQAALPMREDVRRRSVDLRARRTAC